MTPKEKAVNIVEKYSLLFWNNGICDYEQAKQCALISVDEILNNEKNYMVGYSEILHDEYWNAVKQEIEKL